MKWYECHKMRLKQSYEIIDKYDEKALRKIHHAKQNYFQHKKWLSINLKTNNKRACLYSNEKNE